MLIILLLFINILLIPSIAIAEVSDSYDKIATVLNDVLNAFSWFGYAIALGILIWIGIKYILSGANERAKLKGTVSMYLIGVALIVLCSTIASGVAELANKDGTNTAEGVIEEGIKLSGITFGEKEKEPLYKPQGTDVKVYEVDNKYGNDTRITEVNGVVTKEEVLDENGNVIAEYICGEDELGRTYKYLNAKFSDNNYDKETKRRTTERIYDGLQLFDVIDREALKDDGYSVGELEYRTSEKGKLSETYYYTVPIFKNGELKGSYEVTITGWENGFVHTKVDMMENGKLAGSVVYKINGDKVKSKEDRLTTEYILYDSEGSQIGESYTNSEYKTGDSKEEMNQRSENVQKIKDAMKTFTKGGVGIFNNQ